MKQMSLIEMDGFLKGKCIPRDLKVNETNAEYLVRKFAEAEAKCAALAAENTGLKSGAMDEIKVINRGGQAYCVKDGVQVNPMYMTTITKERLLTIKQWRETYGPGSNVVLPAEEAEELARIALASLEAEPIGFRCRRNDNLGDWSYVYHREPDDFERKHLVIEGIYAAPPAPVVPEEKPMPNPLSMLEREITQLIGDAQEATVTGYELIAEAWRLMDGQDPKTSDWHSKASKYLNSNIVEKVDDDRIEVVKAVLRRLAGNSPVTPDGWISCSERMPEDTKMLLAFSQGEIVAAYWNWVVNPIDYKKYRAFTYLSGNILDDVTHWMPLPEPPQHDGE